jgi:hypothetical protein
MNRLSAFVLAFLVSSIPLALSASSQCSGCDGQAGPNGGVGAANAGSPCIDTPGTVWGDWVIEVTVVVTDGSCESNEEGDCTARPCQNEVSYGWGSGMADGGLAIGSIDTTDPLGAKMYYAFPGGPPWKPGQFGSIVFPAGSSPGTSCGNELTFFMEAHVCGDQLATTTSHCFECLNGNS